MAPRRSTLAAALLVALVGTAHAATYVPEGYVAPDASREACDPFALSWKNSRTEGGYDLPGQTMRPQEQQNVDPPGYDWFWCAAQATDSSASCPNVYNRELGALTTQNDQNTQFAPNAYAVLIDRALKAVTTVKEYADCRNSGRVDGRPIPSTGCQAGFPTNATVNPGRQALFLFEWQMIIECPPKQAGGPNVEITLMSEATAKYDATRAANDRYFDIGISYETTNAGVPVCRPKKAGCAACKTNLACARCSEGFRLSKGKCSKCKVTNCKSCNSTGVSGCQTCRSGYKLSKGKCVKK